MLFRHVRRQRGQAIIERGGSERGSEYKALERAAVILGLNGPLDA